jgi:hypothetical protein
VVREEEEKKEEDLGDNTNTGVHYTHHFIELVPSVAVIPPTISC